MITFLKLKQSGLTLLFISILMVGGVFRAPAGMAADRQKLAIAPFQINAEKDYGFMSTGVQDMLTSRLAQSDNKIGIIDREKTQQALKNYSQPLTSSSARTLGKTVGADFVLYGSLTFFGEAASIDGKVVDVRDQTFEKAFFSQTDNVNELLLLINDFARNIAAGAFGPPETAAPATTPQALAPAIPAVALPQSGPLTVTAAPPPKPPSPFVVTSRDQEQSEFWKSQEFTLPLKGLASADLTGDGQIEIVMIADQTILIHRFTAEGLTRLAEIQLKRYQEIITVDAADINGNGRAEIFITCLHTTSFKLDSFVLEFDGRDFATLVENQNWYFRVLQNAEQTPVLLGQARGVGDLFYGPVQQLMWQGRNYGATQPLPLPGNITIYNFTMANIVDDTLPAAGAPDVIIFDKNDYLRIYRGQQEFWRSPERHGGSENYLLTSRQAEDRWYLSQRMLPLTIAGKSQLLLVTHDSLAGTLFERFRHYSGAVFKALAWNGHDLAPDWQTHKINGYVSDFVVADVFNDGQPELAALVIERRGGVLQQPKSHLVVYRLASLYH